jgi:hypothetical protein
LGESKKDNDKKEGNDKEKGRKRKYDGKIKKGKVE